MVRNDIDDGDGVIRNYRLIEARKRAGFTQGDVADRIGINYPSYSTYELMRARPPEKIKERIGEVLGENVGYLFPDGLDVHYRDKSDIDVYDRFDVEDDPRILGNISRKMIIKASLEGMPSEIDIETSLGRDMSYEMDMETYLDNKKIARLIIKAFNNLSPGEERVLRARFGIGIVEESTLEEIGKTLGVTRENIRQTEARALKKLRRKMLMMGSRYWEF